MVLDAPMRKDYIFYNQWNYRSRLIHMELGVTLFLVIYSGKRNQWISPQTLYFNQIMG